MYVGKYLIGAVLPQFKFFRNLRMFFAKSVLQKFRAKNVFFPSLVAYSYKTVWNNFARACIFFPSILLPFPPNFFSSSHHYILFDILGYCWICVLAYFYPLLHTFFYINVCKFFYFSMFFCFFLFCILWHIFAHCGSFHKPFASFWLFLFVFAS